MANHHRRAFLAGASAAAAFAGLPSSFASTLQRKHAIPLTGESLHPIGLGSWITFNVGKNKRQLKNVASIIEAFHSSGGQLIDSSPMYGSAEKSIGYGLSKLPSENRIFTATKTWANTVSTGREQFCASKDLWQRESFDLMQVHNLLNWRNQLAMLNEKRREGQVRYLGVTTSHGRRHEELLSIMQSVPLDFIQVTYNIQDDDVERKILPLAAEKGIAVIANRPFRGGQLFKKVRDKRLPKFANEAGCKTWASFFLRFIISHPAITCAIPATSQLDHLRENMNAFNQVPLPDDKTRTKMKRFWKEL